MEHPSFLGVCKQQCLGTCVHISSLSIETAMVDGKITHQLDGAACILAALQCNLGKLRVGEQSSTIVCQGGCPEAATASGLSKCKLVLVHDTVGKKAVSISVRYLINFTNLLECLLVQDWALAPRGVISSWHVDKAVARASLRIIGLSHEGCTARSSLWSCHKPCAVIDEVLTLCCEHKGEGGKNTSRHGRHVSKVGKCKVATN